MTNRANLFRKGGVSPIFLFKHEFMIRVDKDVHAVIAEKAKSQGISINEELRRMVTETTGAVPEGRSA